MLPNYVGQQRRGTKYRVLFPNLPEIVQQPSSIAVHAKEATHDIAVLTWVGEMSRYAGVLKTGTPVLVDWESPKGDGQFLGYVSTVKQVSQLGGAQPMQIVAIGASYPLKERSNTIYTEATAPEIASAIAARHGLTPDVEQHPLRFNQLAQAGRSDWEFLVELAKKIGYVLRVDRTVLIFRSRTDYMNQESSTAPVLALTSSMGGNEIFKRTLEHFEPLIADYLDPLAGEEANSLKTTRGVDPQTGRIFEYTDSRENMNLYDPIRASVAAPLFEDFLTGSVVNSDLEARMLARGKVEESRFHIPATAKAAGNPRLMPYRPVYISGTGDKTDGYWVIKEAVHHIHSGGTYDVDLVLATDGLGQSVAAPPDVRPLRNLRPTSERDEIRGYLTGYGQRVYQGDLGFKENPQRWQSVPGVRSITIGG